ncbi:hypothetical protein ACGFYP_05220 [Streptomyces sp. NPDC048370]|uniref:hypothetical protein n=1 Tax=Streptomyces sp. NPDC048370 TaxID=3365540 RepID=UPI003721408B
MRTPARTAPTLPRRALVVPVTTLSLALATVATAHPTAAAPSGDPAPVPKATRNGAPAPVKDVLKSCKGANCDFRITQGPTEFLSAVTTVGSAVVNCSDADMTIEREVTLSSSITDNVEGEISGSWTHEGTVDKTVWGEDHAEHTESARLQNTGTTTITGTKRDQTSTNNGTIDHSAPKDKGPNTETHSFTATQNETTSQTQNSAATQTEVASSAKGSVTGHDELHVGVKDAFAAAFRLTAGRELTQSVEERMMYSITLKPKDILTLGAQNAMVRTQGTLRVNDSAGAATVENVSVNSPSTTNASSLISQTYTDAGQCIGVRPTKNAADPQPGPRPRAGGGTTPSPVEQAPRPHPAAPGLYEIPAPPAGSSPGPVKVVPLPPGTTAQP